MSVEIVVRASLILVAAWLATAVLRRGTAATRHRAWTMAFVAIVALPVSMAVLPEWHVLPARSTERLAETFVTSVARPAAVAQPLTAATEAAATQPFGAVAQPFRAAVGAPTLLFLAWALVSAALVLRIIVGIVAVRRLANNARPAPARARTILDDLLADRHITIAVRLLISERVSMPMAWGSRRGVLLLPPDAQEWSEERLRVVLLHEMAHLLRADSLTNALARLAVACHWFNPLAWIALRAMTAERERACDDYVIASGAVPTDYAQHLLDIARDDLAGPAWVMAPAMARRSELEGRLLAIMRPHRVREHRAVALIVTVTSIATAAFVSAASPQATRQTPPAAEPKAAPRPPSVVTEAVKAADQAEMRAERRVRDTLVEALKDSSDDVREKAAMVLAVRSEPDVIPVLIEALGDPSAQVREKAALGLAFRRGPKIVDALLEAARDEDSQVREKAVFGLGMSGDPRALPALVAAAKDPDDQVREKAVQALAFFPRR